MKIKQEKSKENGTPNDEIGLPKDEVEYTISMLENRNQNLLAELSNANLVIFRLKKEIDKLKKANELLIISQIKENKKNQK